MRQYFWANRAYPQNYVATYILWRLCVEPDSPAVDRAWQVVTAWYTQVALKFTEGYDAKFAVIKALKSKAEAIRAQRRASAENTVSPPSAGQSVPTPYIQPTTTTTTDQMMTMPGLGAMAAVDKADSMLLDLNPNEWADWGAFNQTMQNDQSFGNLFWQ
jgi:hypothetical protein